MKTLLISIAFLVLAITNTTGAACSSGGLDPVQLRCEYAENPLGVDVAHPRLFWKLEGTGRAQRQTAWRIFAASAPELLDKDKADLWDSGKVKSDETIHVLYGGRPLKSSQQVFWKVRVWDQDGRASKWSQRAAWTMGMLADTDWKAK